MLKNEKIKVSELQLSFRCSKGRTYYFLRYKKVKEDFYHTGYGSYDIDKVLKWQKECFEIVKKKETNADRIRNMSDEELAEWLTNMCNFEKNEEPYKSIYNLDTEKEEEIHDSYGDLLKWLQSEAE